MEQTIYDRVVRYVMSLKDREFANLNVAAMANSFKIDRFKLLRQFKSRAQMTLEEFLFKEKMNRASFLLIAGRGITVKEVSERVGYCTSDYFIRKFRQYYGVAPGKYKDIKAMYNERKVQENSK